MSKYMPILRFYLRLWVLLMILQSSLTERRIKGKLVPADANKRYAVYLLKANNNKVRYTGWTCGGAIVCRSCVITSAACIEDVEHVYVISGYNKYVDSESIDNDECTKNMKKKVTYTCLPLNYTFAYNKTSVWAYIDIGLIQVESEFQFDDPRYEQYCSYKPQIIPINYEMPPQHVGNDAFVLGWGHKYKWRNEKDGSDLNQKQLRYAPTRILDKTECKKYFKQDSNMERIIDTYMICTLQKGNLDTKGNIIKKIDPSANGCGTDAEKLMGGPACHRLTDYGSGEILDDDTVIPNNNQYEIEDDLAEQIVYLDETRKRNRNFDVVLDEEPAAKPALRNVRKLDSKYVQETGKPDLRIIGELDNIHLKGTNNNETSTQKNESLKATPSTKQNSDKNGPDQTMRDVPVKGVAAANININEYESDSEGDENVDSKPNENGEKPGKKVPGFCQNDHGGPLVTWEGMHEVLIGVASVFKLDGKNHCRGPFLFTSTQCNGGFLNCIIKELDGKDKSRRCANTGHESYELVQRRISWVGHPDGPAENERIVSRVQVPMSAYQPG